MPRARPLGGRQRDGEALRRWPAPATAAARPPGRPRRRAAPSACCPRSRHVAEHSSPPAGSADPDGVAHRARGAGQAAARSSWPSAAASPAKFASRLPSSQCEPSDRNTARLSRNRAPAARIVALAAIEHAQQRAGGPLPLPEVERAPDRETLFVQPPRGRDSRPRCGRPGRAGGAPRLPATRPPIARAIARLSSPSARAVSASPSKYATRPSRWSAQAADQSSPTLARERQTLLQQRARRGRVVLQVRQPAGACQRLHARRRRAGMLRQRPRQPAPPSSMWLRMCQNQLSAAAQPQAQLRVAVRRSGSTPGRRAGCRAPPPAGPARRLVRGRAGAAPAASASARKCSACQRRERGAARRVSARLSSAYSRIVSSIAKRGSPSAPSICRSRLLASSAPTPSSPVVGRQRGPAPRSALPTASAAPACSRRRRRPGGGTAPARPGRAGRSSRRSRRAASAGGPAGRAGRRSAAAEPALRSLGQARQHAPRAAAAHPRGGQLDRQRQPVEPAADAAPRAGRSRRSGRSRLDRPRPLRRTARTAPGRSRRPRRPAPAERRGSGTRQRRHGQLVLAARRAGRARLVASTSGAAQAASSSATAAARRRAPARSCRGPAAARGPAGARSGVSSGGWAAVHPDAERLRDRRHDESGSRIGASAHEEHAVARTRRAQLGRRPQRQARLAAFRRGPVSVTRRARREQLPHRAASSRSRPTKLVS